MYIFEEVCNAFRCVGASVNLHVQHIICVEFIAKNGKMKTVMCKNISKMFSIKHQNLSE